MFEIRMNKNILKRKLPKVLSDTNVSYFIILKAFRIKRISLAFSYKKYYLFREQQIHLNRIIRFDISSENTEKGHKR